MRCAGRPDDLKLRRGPPTGWIALALLAGCLTKGNPFWGRCEGGATGGGTTTATTIASATAGMTATASTAASTTSTTSATTPGSGGAETTETTGGGGGAAPGDVLVWYRFDEDLGNVIPDDGPHGLDGMCSQCINYEPGIHGSAGAFSYGVNIRVDDDPELQPPTVSVAAWINVDTLPFEGEFGAVLAKPLGNEIANSYELFLWTVGPSTTQIRFGVENGSDSTQANTVYPDDGSWHHVAGTFDGNEVRVYLDGELGGTEAGPGPAYDGNWVHIGHDFDYGTEASSLEGLIDDLRVYSRALEPGEIAALAALP